MDSRAQIPLRDLVLVGGGHAHIHVLKMFGMQPLANLRVTLIGRDVETPYSGMLPGYVTGQYTFDECHIDLSKFCSWAGVRFIHAEVVHIDTSKKQIFCKDGRPPFRYDVLSIDIGIVPKPLPCFSSDQCPVLLREAVVPVKPIDQFTRHWQAIVDKIARLDINSKFVVAVVGAGAGGVELAIAVNFRLRQVIRNAGGDPSLLQTLLVTKGAVVLPSHSTAVRSIVLRLLHENGVHVLSDTDVLDLKVSDGPSHFLVTSDGREIPFHRVFWCTQAMAAPWLQSSGLDLDEDNFIKVNASLESVNVKDVFAAGDVCHNVAHPRPKAGVFAVRAGPPLYRNVRAALLGEPLEAWEPQTEFLGILSIAQGYAVASKGGMGLEGAHLYRLKEKIDRTWMLPFQELPVRSMAGGTPPHEGGPSIASTLAREQPSAVELLYHAKMRCGGCGSKVGATVLSRALRKARKYLAHTRDDVLLGMGDDCAVVTCPRGDSLLVHTIDYFRGFVDDLFVLGQIAANHALSDIFSMNAAPATALALVCLPLAEERILEGDLVQLLAGVGTVLKQCGCALVGGHTSEGAELGVGLAVTGYAQPSAVLYKSVYQAPDLAPVGGLRALMPGISVRGSEYALVLTKALGTGALFAAHMRAQTRGRYVAEALQSMLLSNQPAARILAQHGCLACTDVTGFGLVGHLVEMLKPPARDEDKDEDEDEDEDVCTAPRTAFRYGVRLFVSEVPMLGGALECVQRGVVSSLQAQNVRSARAIANIDAAGCFAQYPLLFDPQTSGGLLAFVRRDRCAELLRQLREAGCGAAATVGELILVESHSATHMSAGNDVPLVYLTGGADE